MTEEESHEGETEMPFTERFRSEKRNFILGIYEREAEINRVTIDIREPLGNGVEDCDDACNNRGICRNFTCY